jgi:hypothetical protein
VGSHHPPPTQTVETVEKVPFQKLIIEKWDRNIEKRLVFCVLNNILAIFEPFLSLLWEIFVGISQAKGFSIVSLGACAQSEIIFFDCKLWIDDR